MRLRHCISAFALVLAAVAVTAGRGAAQTGSSQATPDPEQGLVAGKCAQCELVSVGGVPKRWQCGYTYQSGGKSCAISADAQACALVGICPTVQKAPLDATEGGIGFLLRQDGPLPSAVERVAVSEGEVQLRARCNGTVLARAFSAALAGTLREQSETLSL